MLLASILMLLAVSPAPGPAPAASTAPKGPVVVLETTLGRIRLGLHQDKAPLSTANFVQYVKDRHYDGLIFHRVIPGFMIQGGGMDSEMKERDTRAPIKNEAANGLSNVRGSLAMARTSDPNSATGQFFINVVDNGKAGSMLDPRPGSAGYAVFGEVIEGMDVVDRIAAVPTRDTVPVTPVVIQRAFVEGAAAAKPAATAKPAPAPKPSPRASAKPAAKPSARPAAKASPKPAAKKS